MLDTLWNYMSGTGTSTGRTLYGDAEKVVTSLYTGKGLIEDGPLKKLVQKELKTNLKRDVFKNPNAPEIQMLSGFVNPKSATTGDVTGGYQVQSLRALYTPITENSLNSIYQRNNQTINSQFRQAGRAQVSAFKFPTPSSNVRAIKAPSTKAAIKTRRRRSYQPNIYADET